MSSILTGGICRSATRRARDGETRKAGRPFRLPAFLPSRLPAFPPSCLSAFLPFCLASLFLRQLASRSSEHPPHHARHDARGSSRRVRLPAREDAAPRSAGARRRPLRAGAGLGADHAAGTRQPDDRLVSLHARRPRQRRLLAERHRADAGRDAARAGLPHGRVRQRVRARPALRPRARLRYV